MQKSLRLALVSAAVAAGALVPSSGAVPAEPTGSVNGVEQPFINALAACKAVQWEALELASTQPKNEPIAPLLADLVKPKVLEAMDRLAAIMTGLDETDHPILDDSMVDAARELMAEALALNERAMDALKKGKPGSQARNHLDSAELKMRQALLYLQDIRSSRRDAAQLDANPPAPACCIDPDIASLKNFLKITPADVAAGKADYLKARGAGKKPPKVKQYHYKYLSTTDAKAARPLPNYYYAFEGTAADPGYIYKSLGRPLFGPFETRFQVGAFDPNATGNTGSACVEFDLEGSSPLQFVAVCGRRVDGGVQVFIQTHEGAAGNVFLESTRIAQVVVDYSGTAFTVRAGIQDTPDFALFPVGTVAFAQGETALIAGLGASGLTKGTEIGLDEIYFTPK